ncbi:MAG: barstar family protein [Propionibacteriaceae bacterium]|nr:barstar family protein [Propionibacteriaceae bacterium]
MTGVEPSAPDPSDPRWVVRDEFIIEGANFSTMDGFYDEVERVFTAGLTWRIGRNLDAFNDVLRGGFGRYEYGAPILVTWRHHAKSERDLGADMVAALDAIILDDQGGHDCLLVID